MIGAMGDAISGFFAGWLLFALALTVAGCPLGLFHVVVLSRGSDAVRRLVGAAGGLAVCMLMVFGVWAGVNEARLYYNVSGSLPPGWYLCFPIAPQTVLARGTLVKFIPPIEHSAALARRFGTQVLTLPWMKRIAARGGAQVCWEKDGMQIDGARTLPLPLLKDYDIVPLEGCHTLTAEELVVLGSGTRSYDSRYLGVIQRSSIEGTCTAVWTWEEGS